MTDSRPCMAAWNGHKDTVLASLGADVNQAMNDGFTPVLSPPRMATRTPSVSLRPSAPT